MARVALATRFAFRVPGRRCRSAATTPEHCPKRHASRLLHLIWLVFFRRTHRRLARAQPAITQFMNETHDSQAKSWVESANLRGTDFPIQNLPLGVFVRPQAENAVESIGVAIGDKILNLSDCAEDGLLADEGAPDERSEACVEYCLNPPMELSPAHWTHLRSLV